MSNKKKRNKRRHRGPTAGKAGGSWVEANFFDQSNDEDCCILCKLWRQAEEQDDAWSVSDRADDLVATMRAAQEWDGGFTPLINSSRENVDRFAYEWLRPRGGPGAASEGMRVAVTALGRFWDSYHQAAPAA